MQKLQINLRNGQTLVVANNAPDNKAVPLFARFFPTLAADSGFFQLEARIHRAFQNFKIYVGVATTFVSGKCSFLLKAEGASTRLRVSKLNTADIRSNKPAS